MNEIEEFENAYCEAYRLDRDRLILTSIDLFFGIYPGLDWFAEVHKLNCSRVFFFYACFFLVRHNHDSFDCFD